MIFTLLLGKFDYLILQIKKISLKLNYFCFKGSLLVSQIYSLYSPSDEVILLNSANFRSKVIESNDIWIVE
jgi:hypothetical protein